MYRMYLGPLANGLGIVRTIGSRVYSPQVLGAVDLGTSYGPGP